MSQREFVISKEMPNVFGQLEGKTRYSKIKQALDSVGILTVEFEKHSERNKQDSKLHELLFKNETSVGIIKFCISYSSNIQSMIQTRC